MAARLKFSPAFREMMYRVQQRLELGSRDHLWTLRIALARSLQSNVKIGLQTDFDFPEALQENKPFEIDVIRIEQKDGQLFRALIQQLYQKKFSTAEYEEYLSKHVEHGLLLIDQETRNPNSYRGYEYLTALAQRGIREAGLEDSEEASLQEPIQIEGFEGIISLRIGVEKNSGEVLNIEFNKIDEHLNNYMGVIGRPGSGKTYFVKYLLSELRKVTKYKTNFLIFDYAKGDIAGDPEFINQTNSEVITVGKEPIPVNIFQVPSNLHKDKKFAAERIVNIVRNVEANIGKVQEQNLFDAIVRAYEDLRYEEIQTPDFYMVREYLEDINPKPDSLTSVFRPLTEHNLFVDRHTPAWDSLVNRTVIFDIHELPALKDLCVFLILNQIYRELMLLPDSLVDPNSRGREMRTVIVIDEAHHFLKSKKRVKILEDLIREIRSKGASVILLSQSPDDYDNADFNFLELLEFVYVLGCNPSSYKFLQQVFGVSTDVAKKLMREVTKLGQGEAIAKGNEQKTLTLALCK